MKRSPHRKSRTNPGVIFLTRSGNGWMAGCRSSPVSPSARKPRPPRREENAGRLSASHILFPAPTRTTLRTEQKGHTGPSQASCAALILSALRSTDSPFPWRMCRTSLPRKSPDGSPPSGLPDFPESSFSFIPLKKAHLTGVPCRIRSDELLFRSQEPRRDQCSLFKFIYAALSSASSAPGSSVFCTPSP